MILKPSSRAFLVSFSSALFCLSVLGMAAVLLLKPMEAPRQDPSINSIYLPQEQDSLTALVIGMQKDQPPMTFMLIRFHPLKGSIPVTALPGNTSITFQKHPWTLQTLYEKEGVTGVRQALGETFGIQIQRYAKVSLSGFEKIVNLIGSISFPVPKEISLKQGDITVSLSEGIQLIDGKKAAALSLYEGYSSQQERCGLLAELAANAINQHLNLVHSDMAERLFRGVVNNMDTDISSLDYADRRQAAEFMADLRRNPSTAIVPELVPNPGSAALSVSSRSAVILKNQFG